MNKQPMHWSCQDVWQQVSGCVGSGNSGEVLREK